MEVNPRNFVWMEPAVANLRYARSGHRSQVARVQQRREQALSSSTAKRTLGTLVLCAVGVPVLCAALLRLVPAPLPSPPLASPPLVASPALAVISGDDADTRALAVPVQPIDSIIDAANAPSSGALNDTIKDGESMSSALARVAVGAQDRSALVRALADSLDGRGVRAGAPFVVVKNAVGEVVHFELHTLNAALIPRQIVAQRVVAAITAPTDEDTFVVTHTDAPVLMSVVGVTGTVRSSLYQAMVEQGEDAGLVDRFVDVFAWNIDFYRQTQRGDTFKILVEKKTAGGRFLGYGKVIAAEFKNAGRVHRGFLFHSADGKHDGTYDDSGNALMRTFLKSPMEVARITSSYGMRFHPVLGKNKQHQGVDYGAAIGTPVWAVADGIVQEAHYSSTAGNMVSIQHMNGLATEYFHLSKFADGLHAGSRVTQKQLVGYVGTTGLSTGPHLHFGMLKNGSHVDPQAQKFPNARPVPHEYQSELERFIAPLLAQFAALDRA